jgi:uncharacterized protein
MQALPMLKQVLSCGIKMSLIIQIKVVPSSGHTKWTIDKSGILKAYLKNPPEKGLANDELIKTIAKALKITQAQVTIISGATSRIKRVKINRELTYDQMINTLGIERQNSLFDKE